VRQLLRQLIGGHIRVLVERGDPVLKFEMTRTRMLLAGGMSGPSDRVGSRGQLRSVRVTISAARLTQCGLIERDDERR